MQLTEKYASRMMAQAQNLSTQLSDFPLPNIANLQLNPLHYAWQAHCQYLKKFANSPKRNLILGMNPGPFGMVQTGIPFGEIATVKDWLGIDDGVAIPQGMEARVKGFACTRSEVSGRRLWGYFRRLFPVAEDFFTDNLVLNYCPLAFFADNKNITPDKFTKQESAQLYAACDEHLQAVCQILEVKNLIAVGQFAEKSALRACTDLPLKIVRIIHPSPANPLANHGWEDSVEKTMREHKISLSSDV